MKHLFTTIVCLATLAIGGCAANSGLTGGAHAAGDPGLRYRLPVDVAVVKVTLTTTRTTKVKNIHVEQAQPGGDVRKTKKLDRKPPTIDLETSTDVSHEVDLQLQAVADPSQTYLLNLLPEKTRDSTLGVHVSPAGLLESINITSDGRGPDILKSIGRLTGTVVSLTTGAPLLSTERSNDGAMKILDEELSLCDQPTAPDMVVLPLDTRAMLVEWDAACLVFRRMQVREREIAAIDETLALLTRQLGQATGDAVKELKARIDLAQAQRDQRTKVMVEQAAYVQNLLTEYRRQRSIGTKVTTESFNFVFDIDKLAAIKEVSAAPTNGALRIALKSKPQALDALDAAGIVLAADFVAAAATTAPTGEVKPAPAPSPTVTPAPKQPQVKIFYRQPRRLRMTLYLTQPTATEGDAAQPERRDKATAPVKLGTTQIADVILPATAPDFVEFESRAFGNGKLALKFNAGGRPTQIDQNSTASVAAALGAIDSATGAAFDAFNETTKKLTEVQDNRRKLSLGDLETRLARLKKEKEVLDAEGGLEAGRLTAANSMRQQQISSDLATLQAEIGLATVQANQQAQLETSTMKAQIEKLTQELALLKAQLELAKAKGGVE